MTVAETPERAARMEARAEAEELIDGLLDHDPDLRARLFERVAEALEAHHAASERARAMLADDARVLDMAVRDGVLQLGLQGPMPRVIAASLAEMLGEAPNYVQMEVLHPEKGRLTCTVQRAEGETPAAKADRLSALAADLARALAARAGDDLTDSEKLLVARVRPAPAASGA